MGCTSSKQGLPPELRFNEQDLCDFIKIGDLDALQMCLTKNNVNYIDHRSKSLMHHAAQFQQYQCASILMDKRAPINSKTRSGETALMTCASNGCVDILKLLVQNGAELEIKDRNGCTAVHFAAWHGKTEILKILLEANCIPTEISNEGL